MPIHLPPISRRRFLASTIAAAAAAALGRRGLAADDAVKIDPNRFALLSDTHLAADVKAKKGEVAMFDNFEKVRADVLAGTSRPAAVLVNGDLAYNVGTPGDYGVVVDALRPIRAAGAAGDLADELKRPLPRPQIAALEAQISIDHADHRQVGKVVALGDDLRADKNVDLVVRHPLDDRAHFGAGLGGV